MTTPFTYRLTLISPVLASAALATATLVDLSPQADDTGELVTLIAQSPGRWSAGQVLFGVCGVLWLVAGGALMRLFRPEERLGKVAGAVVAVGGLAMLPMDAAGFYLRHLASGGIPHEQQVALADSVESSLALMAVETIHVAGFFLGVLMVAIALFRRGGRQRWAAAVVIVAVLGLAASPSGPAAAAAAALLALGFGLAWRRATTYGRSSGSYVASVAEGR